MHQKRTCNILNHKGGVTQNILMPLRLILSPYSLSGSGTKLTFTTTHVAPGESVITMEQIAEIPEVTQPDEKIMDCILSIVDQIIQCIIRGK